MCLTPTSTVGLLLILILTEQRQ